MIEITCPACRKVGQFSAETEAVCGRCGCGLDDLLAIARAANARLHEACDALRTGQAGLALEHADHSWRLRRSQRTAAVAALAAACSGEVLSLERWRHRWAESST